MNRPNRRLFVPVLILLLGVIGATSATATILRSAPPVRKILVQTTNPGGTTDRTMYLQRVTIPGNTPLVAHTHQGTQIAAITTGTLRYHVITGKPVKVVKSNALGTEPAFIRLIKPGQTYDVKPGFSVIEPAGTAHELQAIGSTAVIIYAASLLLNGAKLSDPYTATD